VSDAAGRQRLPTLEGNHAGLQPRRNEACGWRTRFRTRIWTRVP
jgi:hypothetical protein